MKSYLGDGVYIEMAPIGFILTTENGIEVTNTIVLEDETLLNLVKWTEAELAKRGVKP